MLMLSVTERKRSLKVPAISGWLFIMIPSALKKDSIAALFTSVYVSKFAIFHVVLILLVEFVI